MLRSDHLRARILTAAWLFNRHRFRAPLPAAVNSNTPVHEANNA
jgi:hypothetical protein